MTTMTVLLRPQQRRQKGQLRSSSRRRRSLNTSSSTFVNSTTGTTNESSSSSSSQQGQKSDRSFSDTSLVPQQAEEDLHTNDDNDIMSSSTSCTMTCYNGGQCHRGRPAHGTFANELLQDENDSKLHFVQHAFYAHHNDNDNHINNASTSMSSSNSIHMYCVCPIGWTGLHCEIMLEPCWNDNVDDRTCWNGSPCVVEETIGDGDGSNPTAFSHCECNAQHTNFTLPYVSHFCGQLATVSCAAAATPPPLSSSSSSNNNINSSSSTTTTSITHSFCKNGGKCLDVVTDPNQPHVGCQCRDGWDGPHCEHIQGIFPTHVVETPHEKEERIWFSLVGMTMAIVILCMVYRIHCHRRRCDDDGRRLPCCCCRRRCRKSSFLTAISSRNWTSKSKRRRHHHNHNARLDYDAFLEECESSNDYRDDDDDNDDEQALVGKKQSSSPSRYSDFDSTSDDEEEQEEETTMSSAYSSNSNDSTSERSSCDGGGESGDESDFAMHDDIMMTTSSLYVEPRTPKTEVL